jgi:hypothetical protein
MMLSTAFLRPFLRFQNAYRLKAMLREPYHLSIRLLVRAVLDFFSNR